MVRFIGQQKLILDGDKCSFLFFSHISLLKNYPGRENTRFSIFTNSIWASSAHLFSNAPPSALQSKCSLDGLDSKETQPPLPPKADKYSQLKAPQTSSEGKNIPPSLPSPVSHHPSQFSSSATKWQVKNSISGVPIHEKALIKPDECRWQVIQKPHQRSSSPQTFLAKSVQDLPNNSRVNHWNMSHSFLFFFFFLRW